MRTPLVYLLLFAFHLSVWSNESKRIDSLLNAAEAATGASADSLFLRALDHAAEEDSAVFYPMIHRVKGMRSDLATSWIRFAEGQWLRKHDQPEAALVVFQSILTDPMITSPELRFLSTFRSAIVHFDAGSLDQALSYALQSIEEAGNSSDPSDMLDALNFTGEVYRIKQDYGKAIPYYDRGLALAQESNDSLFMVRIHSNKGIALVKLKRYDEAKESLQSGLHLARELGNRYGEAVLLTNLGFNEKERGNPALAIEFYQASLSIKEGLGNKVSIAYTLNDIGESLSLLGRYDESIAYSKKALQLAKEAHSMYYMKDMNKTLAHTYAAAGRYDSAYFYQSEFQELSDSIFNDESFQEIARLEKLHELREKSLENSLLAQEKEEAELIIAQQRWWIILAIIVVLSALMIGFLLWRNNVVRAKFVDVLESRNHDLDEKNAALEQLINEQEGLFNIVTHDLKGPLINAQRLLEMETEEANAASRQELGPMIRTSVSSALDFINEFNTLHEYEKSQQAPPLEVVNLTALIQESIARFQPTIEDKELSIHFRTDHAVAVTTVSIYVRHIVHNLISNAVKFSSKKGSVFITITQGDTTRISVEDQGQGIAEEELPKVFDRFYRGTAGALHNRSNGLGLALVKLLVEKLGGQVRVKSTVGIGSEFIVQIP